MKFTEEARRLTAGFVLDFVGIFEKLEQALAFSDESDPPPERRPRRS